MDNKRTIYNLFQGIWNNEKISTSLIATTIFCLITHGYAYTHTTFFADRMGFFNQPSFGGAAAGRWFQQYVYLLFRSSYLPWLDGVLTILILAFSVYLIVSILNIKKKLSIWIIAGLCATNGSVIAAHMYWAYSILIALLFACLSAYFWKRDDWKPVIRIAGAAGFLCLSFATYGAYPSAGTSIVIIALIIGLLENKDAKRSFVRGLEYIISFFLGAVIYYVILRIFLSVQTIEVSSYMGEDVLTNGASLSELLRCIGIAYARTLQWFLGIEPPWRHLPVWCAVAIFVLGIVMFGILIKYRKERLREPGYAPMMLFLILVFPLSLGLIYVMSFNHVHYLMLFSFVFLYIGFVKLAEMVYSLEAPKNIRINGRKGAVSITIILLGYFVIRGIYVGNMTYVRAEQVSMETEHIAERLISRIEDCEGFTGEETIVFVGDVYSSPYFSSYHNEEKYWLDILEGMGIGNKYYTNGYTYNGNMYPYLKKVMNVQLPMEQYDPDSFSQLEKDQIGEMLSFPTDGSIRKLGNRIIVKLNEVAE